MKFYCDNCGAKYQISDEKVRGKVLRIRCKKCSEPILVKEPARPDPGSAQQSLRTLQSRLRSTSRPPLQRGQAEAARGETQAAALQWYYSIGGQTFGPMGWAVLSHKFERGELGDEAYVWNKTMAEWIPAVHCPELQPHFKGGKTRRPSNPTISLGAADIRQAAQARMAALKGAGGAAAAGSTQGTGPSAEARSSRILKRASKTLSAAPRAPILSKAASSGGGESLQSPAARQASGRASGVSSSTGGHAVLDGKVGPDTTQERLKALRQRLRPDEEKPRSSLRERLRAAARKAEAKRRDDESVKPAGAAAGQGELGATSRGRAAAEAVESADLKSVAVKDKAAAAAAEPVSSLAASLRAVAERRSSKPHQEASADLGVAAPKGGAAPQSGDQRLQEFAVEKAARAAGLDPADVTMEMSLGAALEVIADQVQSSDANDVLSADVSLEQSAQEQAPLEPGAPQRGEEPAGADSVEGVEGDAVAPSSAASGADPAANDALSADALDDDDGIQVFAGGAAAAPLPQPQAEAVEASVVEAAAGMGGAPSETGELAAEPSTGASGALASAEEPSLSLESAAAESEAGQTERASHWSRAEAEDHTLRAELTSGMLAAALAQESGERRSEESVKIEADPDVTAVLEVNQALLDEVLEAEAARLEAERGHQPERALEGGLDDLASGDATSLTVSAISDEDALALDDLKALSAAATEAASVGVSVDVVEETSGGAAEDAEALAVAQSEQELVESLRVEGVEGAFWSGSSSDESDSTVPELSAFAAAMSEQASPVESIQWPAPADEAPVSPVEPIKQASASAGAKGSQLRPASKAAQDSFARDDEMSASLLIQIDDVKKSKRRQNTVMIVVAVASLLLLAGVGVAVMSVSSTATQELAQKANESRERQEQAKAERKRQDEKVDKPKGYDPDELSKLGGIVPSAQAEADAGVEVAESEAEADAGQRADNGKRVAAKGRGDGRLIDITGLTRDNNKFDKAMERTDVGQGAGPGGASGPGETGLRLKTTGEGDVVKSEGPVGGVGRVDGKEAPGEDPLKALGSMSPSQVEGRQRDGAADRGQLPLALSREDLSKGFVNIRKSVFQCVERHTKRSGNPMDSGKVRVTVTILNNGSVGDVSIDAELRNTVFGLCMKSHTSRWRFPQFQGTSMKVKRTFVIQ